MNEQPYVFIEICDDGMALFRNPNHEEKWYPIPTKEEVEEVEDRDEWKEFKL